MVYRRLVYFKGSGVRIPCYPVTVIGKIPPNGHWETGKAGGKCGMLDATFAYRPISQETLIYTGFVETRNLFPGFEDRAMRKIPFNNPVIYLLQASFPRRGTSDLPDLDSRFGKEFLCFRFIG